MIRRLLYILTLGAVAGIALSFFNPVSSKLLRLAFIAFIVMAWLGPLVLFWRSKSFRYLWMLLPALPLIAILLPSRPWARDELRDDYVKRMQAFQGVRYFWGGESRQGFDCSGLPRRSLRDALTAYGLRHADGAALRLALEQWWYDASAEALGQGYRNYTRSLGLKGRLREMDVTSLSPGDLAVTTNGRHVLAYVGQGRWIQADISLGKVVELDAKADENPWLTTPVTLHRWQILDVSESTLSKFGDPNL